MAGIYEKATQLRPASFALLTTRANELMSSIHDRMPVILEPERARRWLNRGPLTAEEVAGLCTPLRADVMEAVPISGLVNDAANDMPEVLEPANPPPPKHVQAELF
jgi:putative SOS response-associated peptidase YedK